VFNKIISSSYFFIWALLLLLALVVTFTTGSLWGIAGIALFGWLSWVNLKGALGRR
jgi:hypothetical protein